MDGEIEMEVEDSMKETGETHAGSETRCTTFLCLKQTPNDL